MRVVSLLIVSDIRANATENTNYCHLCVAVLRNANPINILLRLAIRLLQISELGRPPRFTSNPLQRIVDSPGYLSAENCGVPRFKNSKQ
jgi:hypothetical protein